MSSILPSSEQVTQTNILVQIKYKCIAISGQDTDIKKNPRLVKNETGINCLNS